jgi:hypothetical protein
MNGPCATARQRSGNAHDDARLDCAGSRHAGGIEPILSACFDDNR